MYRKLKMFRWNQLPLLLPVLSAIVLTAVVTSARAGAGENIALGKKYTFSPAPNYVYCTDSGDAVQLTDGETTDQYFWTQPGCVGWNGIPWVDVTIDLEQEEPISSVAFFTAAGTAGVIWPASASFYVSPNGTDWYFIGDLMLLDLEQNGARVSTEYNIRKIAASGLQCKGRFAKILFHTTQAIFTDEIEIGRGDPSLLDRPYPETPETPKTDPKSRVELEDYLNLIRSRYITDANNAADWILEKSTTADSPRKEKLTALAEKVRAIRADENWLSTLDPNRFQTIFPFDSVHAGLFASIAEARRILAPDSAPILIDRIDPYDAPNIFAGSNPIPETPLFMASGEIKPVVYQLLNTTDRVMTVSFSLEEAAAALCQEVFSVRWTDTKQLIPIATALIPLAKSETGHYELTLYPGLSSQIWFDVSAKGSKAGSYQGAIHFKTDQFSAEKSLPVEISTVTLPNEQTLVLGGWDYTDTGELGPVTAANRDAFISIIQKYGVNGPWATQALFYAGIQVISTDPEHLQVEIQTDIADQWLSRWKDAKEFYLTVPDKFCGYSHESEEFSQLVTDWAKKCGQWFESKGISPSRVSFLIQDEPRPDLSRCCERISAWAKAIRAGEPRFRIWEDPIYQPVTATPKELLESCDTLCPKRTDWLTDRNGFEKTYRPYIDAGKRLDFYSCSGPVLMLDPYFYHRLQAWQLFREGGKSSFFWSFFDGTGTPWNAYKENRDGYAPLFIDPNSSEVIPAKQIAAMRESVYDFEILTMYKNRLEERRLNGNSTEKEEQWLIEQIDALPWDRTSDHHWPSAKDRTGADKIREEILRRLEAMP